MTDFVSHIFGDISDCLICAWMKVVSFNHTVFQWKQLSTLSFEVTSCMGLIRRGFKPGLNGSLWIRILSGSPISFLPQMAPLPKMPKPGTHVETPDFAIILLGLQWIFQMFREVACCRLKVKSLSTFLIGQKCLANMLPA